jgi:hypothetical protein
MVGPDVRPVGGESLRRLEQRLAANRSGQSGDGVGSGGGAAERAVASVVETAAGDLDVAPALEIQVSAVMENRIETGETGARGEEHRKQEEGPRLD